MPAKGPPPLPLVHVSLHARCLSLKHPSEATGLCLFSLQGCVCCLQGGVLGLQDLVRLLQGLSRVLHLLSCPQGLEDLALQLLVAVRCVVWRCWHMQHEHTGDGGWRAIWAVQGMSCPWQTS